MTALDRLDCRGTTVEPAQVNAHTHLYSGLAPLGMPAPKAPPENFLQILERVWWRLDRALDEDTLRASARYYVAHALLAGTTTLVDHHESPTFIAGSLDVLADAAHELGARLFVAYGATDRNGGPDEGRRGLEENRRFLRHNTRPRVTGGVGLHASFTVSDETIREAGRLARELGVRMHVHVAEDGADVVDATRRGYAGPLERLAQLGALPRGSILAHGVHLSEPQVRDAESRGCWLVQNPRSNAGNRVGYARALVASRHVALGTDGWAADMAAERAGLRVESQSAAQPLDGELWRARTGGGHALAAELWRDWDDQVAREPDGRARHVSVAGDVVVQDGVLVRAELGKIVEDAKHAAARLWSRMDALP
ncbi:MAG: amidohydrolase family protein [Deltaproteobacteria bacterium]|nr:amidohydrolase family protein [Deltaproteobacteria bacterium]